MKYEKPQVTTVASATEAIMTAQLNKSIHRVVDRNFPKQTGLSAGAYEADE
jgi:hypothetical protein